MGDTRPSIALAAAPLAAAAGLPERWLTPAERERADAHGSGDARRRFVAGRLLVRELAAGLFDAPGGPGSLEVRTVCPWCGPGAHGRPELVAGGAAVPVPLSYSRASGWLLVGVGPPGWRIGVDLADAASPAFAEEPGGNPLDDVAYAPRERALLEALEPGGRPLARARWWALKEALGKALGEGIAGPGGPPVVAGAGRHEALRDPRAVAEQVDAERVGLPAGLVAAAVLLPRG